MSRDLFGYDAERERRVVPAAERAQRADLFDFKAVIRRETPLAYLVHDGVVETWLPKEHAQDNGDGSFTVPEWLARSKGLID